MPPFFENLLFDLFIILLFVAAVYAFLIMPRQREWKRRQKLVRELQVGTEVLTYGGMVGTIKSIDSSTGLVTIEAAPGVELRFVAAAITQEFNAEEYAQAAQEHMK